MSGGSFLGALAAGFISDHVGRRHAIQFASIVWLIGSTLQSASQDVAMLIVGRYSYLSRNIDIDHSTINGFCVGICSSQVPVFLAEISPKMIRGRIVALQQWAITWGILIMYYVYRRLMNPELISPDILRLLIYLWSWVFPYCLGLTNGSCNYLVLPSHVPS